MYTTKIVDSRSLKKHAWYKVAHYSVFLLLLFFLLQIEEIFGKNIILENTSEEMARNLQKVLLGIMFVFLIIQSINIRRIKSPKEKGQLIIDEETITLIEGEEEVTFNASDLKKINFKYYSYISRYNPRGCTNYLEFFKGDEKIEVEIIVGNELERNGLAEALEAINCKVPIKFIYTRFLIPIIPVKAFKNLKS